MTLATDAIERLRVLAADDPELPRDVVQMFADSDDPRLLREAAVAHETDKVRVHAHRLRSSALAVGSLELADLCAQIERGVGFGALPDSERLDTVDRLVNETSRALAASFR